MPPKRKAAAVVAAAPAAAVAADPAASPGRARSSRSAKPAAGSLAEADDAPGKVLLAEMAARKFWEQWDTPLLFCWLYDFEDTPITPLDAANREKLLSTLVAKGAKRPAAKTALQQLVACWREIAKPTAEDVPPGLFVDARSRPGSPAREPAAAASPAPKQDMQPAKKARLQSPVEVTDDEEDSVGGDVARQLERTFPPLPSAAAAAAAGQSSLSAAAGSMPQQSAAPSVRARPLQCLTCLTAAPGPEASWICASCGLRGDVEADSGANKFLVAKALMSPASSASSASGTRIADTVLSDPASTLSRLDRDFDRQAKHGQPHLLFTGPAAGQAVPVTAAIDIVNRAVGASASQRPSEKLIELVRSGKLVSVGHAIPRLLATAQAGDEANAIGSMLFTEAGTIIQQGKNAPPPVPSSQAFCMALFGTILPALIDRPMAMLEWMALARTALQIEAEPRSNWTRASSYIDQLLQRRIPQRKGISEPSDAVLRTIRNMESFAPQGAGGPSRMERQPDSRRGGDNVCNSWNHGTCERGAACRYRHACAHCGGQHQAKVCASQGSAPRQFPPPRKGGGGGGGSQRSGGASSVTTARAATAAAPSSRQE